MQFDSSTPRVTRTIAGREVSVINPFAAGFVLTEALAAMLNQTLGENFSNNLRAKINDGVLGDDGKPQDPIVPFSDVELQTIVDEYMASYEPGVRSGGGGAPRVTDPVEREARALAKARVRSIVKERGLKEKDVDMADLVTKLFEKNKDAFMAQGKKVVAAQQAAAAKTSDGLDLDIDFSAPSAPVDAEAAPAE